MVGGLVGYIFCTPSPNHRLHMSNLDLSLMKDCVQLATRLRNQTSAISLTRLCVCVCVCGGGDSFPGSVLYWLTLGPNHNMGLGLHTSHEYVCPTVLLITPSTVGGGSGSVQDTTACVAGFDIADELF